MGRALAPKMPAARFSICLLAPDVGRGSATSAMIAEPRKSSLSRYLLISASSCLNWLCFNHKRRQQTATTQTLCAHLHWAAWRSARVAQKAQSNPYHKQMTRLNCSMGKSLPRLRDQVPHQPSRLSFSERYLITKRLSISSVLLVKLPKQLRRCLKCRSRSQHLGRPDMDLWQVAGSTV